MKEFKSNELNDIKKSENSSHIENTDDIDDTDDFDDDSDDFEDLDDFEDSRSFEKEIILVSETENQRIDVFVSEKLRSSRNSVQKLITDGNIKVNEKEIKANYRVKIKDIIKITVPPPELFAVEAEDITLDIVYEDKDLAVINKAQGMVVHPGPGHYSATMVNGLMYHIKSLSTINGPMRPGIVHRLDKDTSGLMLIAKNDRAHIFLARSLKEHSINRIYYALVDGNISKDEGEINAPLGRSEKDRKKRTVRVKKGKEAVTNYWVVERYQKYTLLKLKLKTGRTHQIRVHMKHIGHPVVGDYVYGREDKFALQGQLLHSKILGFVHPSTNKYMEFESDLPDYFLEVLNKIRAYQ